MRKLPAAAGFVGSLVGAAALIGWWTGDMAWVRFRPEWIPLQPGASLAVVLLGAAIVAAALGKTRAAAVLGVAGGLAGVLPLPSGLPEAAAAEPVTAVCALLAGASLFTGGSWRRRGGALLAGFSLAAGFCLWRGLGAAFGWDGLLRLPAGGAAAYASFGLALLGLPSEEDTDDARFELAVPVAVGLAAAAAALCLWLALEAERKARVEWTVAGAADELKERLESTGATALAAHVKDGTLFGSIFPGRPPRTYGLALYVGRLPAYASGPVPAQAAPFKRDTALDVGRGDWRIQVWPSDELLAANASALPRAALAVGLLLAALLALSVRLALIARRQAAEIEAQRKLVELASHAKSRFLANVSRELRNPLNSIQGYSDILLRGQDGPLNAEQQEDLRAVQGGGRALTRVTQQLLELARLEAGLVDMKKEAIAIEPLLNEVRESLAAEAAAKGLGLEVYAQGPAWVAGDRARLAQAVRSVAENAVKFTAKGKISLGLEKGTGGDVVIAVRDSGPGLSEDEKHNLFEPFWQSRGLGGIKKAEGLGLGLHLAKRVVELHGGSISAVGEAGAGSVFFLRLPAAKEGKA